MPCGFGFLQQALPGEVVGQPHSESRAARNQWMVRRGGPQRHEMPITNGIGHRKSRSGPSSFIERRSDGVRASINAGFSRVFLTLLDTHISALIAAAFLFQFGTGPIRGFAVTLSVGLLSNIFTSTFVSKTLFEMALANRRQVATLSI